MDHRPAPPDAVLRDALANLTGGRPAEAAASLPKAPGAYLLLIRLAEACRLDIPRLPAGRLGPGWYLYAGSARGPGGIRARAGRHLRRAGRMRWHVDRLTAAAAGLWAFPAPGGQECALIDALLARPEFETALPGFGSSDCRRCAGHLLVARS